LTNSQITSLVALAAANYPHLQDKDMKPTAALWKEILSDIPFDVAKAAIIKVLSTARFFPTVAEIREACATLTNPQILTPAEAWGQVIKSLQNYGYYRPKEGMEALEPTVQKAVRAFGGFTELCLCENIDVARGQFLKMYDQLAKREKETSVLPESVRQIMAGVAKALPGGD